MSVEQGGPTKGRRPNTGRWTELVDAAMAARGEWFSLPLEGKSAGGIYSSVSSIVGRRFSNISVSEDRVYLRIKP